MAKTKVEVLKETLRRVKESGVTQGRYVRKTEDGCKFCAVGHLLVACGFTDAQIKALDHGGIDDMPIGAYGLFSSYSYKRLDEKDAELGKVVKGIALGLQDLGFTSDEIVGIQSTNDRDYDGDSSEDSSEDGIIDTSKDVAEYLKDMIAELEANPV